MRIVLGAGVRALLECVFSLNPYYFLSWGSSRRTAGVSRISYLFLSSLRRGQAQHCLEVGVQACGGGRAILRERRWES
jgi:hypothetical protein